MLRSTSLAPLLRRWALGAPSTTSSNIGRSAAAGGAIGGARPLSAAAATTTTPPKIEAATPAERSIADLIASKLEGGADRIAVRDTSGGCGSMYTIEVSSPAFAGLRTVQQHVRVTRALGDEVSNWHGFTLVTSAASAGGKGP
jgi:stress-induced morphogen